MHPDSITDTPFKICNKCGKSLPATADHFFRDKSKRGGLVHTCKECKAEYDRAYRETHKERLAEQKRARNLARRECMAEYNRAYREANKERLAEKSRAWREANRGRLAEYFRVYRAANRERKSQYAREWYRANKKRIIDRNRIRRRKQAQELGFWRNCGFNQRAKRYFKDTYGTVPPLLYERIDRRKVFRRDKWICRICGMPILRHAKPPDPHSASVDHIVALAAGGSHTYDNVAAAHLGCNLMKHTEYWG